MPELPEVETIKRGLSQSLIHAKIEKVIVRSPKLRWIIPKDLNDLLSEQLILDIRRRGKYLLFEFAKGTMIIHLGMTGSLWLIKKDKSLLNHDHVDFLLSSGQILRYNDPRRFGAILWTTEKPENHPLLQSMGVEPLSNAFTGAYFKARALKHRAPVKSFLMNAKIVAGIGNIYAAEALFLSQINPKTPVNQLSVDQCEHLVRAIKEVLESALKSGGTTLKNYVNAEGKPGYFTQELYVYGRAGLACRSCSNILKSISLGQRSTVFCPYCQK